MEEQITEEQIILVIENVQSKPKNNYTVKNCDLLITNKRIISIVTGMSSVTSSMLGNVIAGSFGSVWAAAKSNEYSAQTRQSMSSESIDKIMAFDPDCLCLMNEEIKEGYFKTGFLISLGLWSPFQIKTETDKYFFNVPYKKRKNLAAAIREIDVNIKIS